MGRKRLQPGERDHRGLRRRRSRVRGHDHTLNELASQRQIGLAEAAVVSRDGDGHIDVKDQVADESSRAPHQAGSAPHRHPRRTARGPARRGWAGGSLFDLAGAEDTDSVLSEMSKTVNVGRTSLLADVVEQSPEVVDSAMTRHSGTVVRRSVADVESEIAAAEATQREANPTRERSFARRAMTSATTRPMQR
jgi:uncharacterized membrane protein